MEQNLNNIFSVSQHLPKDLVPKLVNYVLSIRRLRLKNQYPLELIGGMDETALWLDMPAPTTLAFTGERSVPIRTTGHEKVSINTHHILTYVPLL